MNIAVDKTTGKVAIPYGSSTAWGSYLLLSSSLTDTGYSVAHTNGGSIGLTGTSGLCFDNSGNIIMIPGSTFNTLALVASYSQTGTRNWASGVYGFFESGSTTLINIGVACDSLDNIYYAFYKNTSGNQNSAIYIVKLNSSGTLQWQRKIEETNYGFYMSKSYPTVNMMRNAFFTVDKNAFYIFTGDSGQNGVIIKLPLDGSKTGTYVSSPYSYTYSTASLSTGFQGIPNYTTWSVGSPGLSTGSATVLDTYTPTLSTTSYTSTTKVVI